MVQKSTVDVHRRGLYMYRMLAFSMSILLKPCFLDYLLTPLSQLLASIQHLPHAEVRGQNII